LQQLKNLSKSLSQFCLEFVEGQEQHSDERNPDLSEDGIPACPKEGFDLQVLLDPFEEKLDLPAVMINVADGFGDQVADVCEENVMLARLRVPVADSAQKNWALFGFGPGQKDQLIGGDPLGAVHLGSCISARFG